MKGSMNMTGLTNQFIEALAPKAAGFEQTSSPRRNTMKTLGITLGLLLAAWVCQPAWAQEQARQDAAISPQDRNLDSDIQAIMDAPDENAAMSRYAAALANQPKSPDLREAYIGKLIDLGKIELAYDPAKDLVKLDSNSALGWSVVGYVNMQRGHLAEAASALAKASDESRGDPFVESSIGQLVAWHDMDQAKADDQTERTIAGLRGQMQNEQDYLAGYKAYRDAAANDQPAETTASSETTSGDTTVMTNSGDDLLGEDLSAPVYINTTTEYVAPYDFSYGTAVDYPLYTYADYSPGWGWGGWGWGGCGFGWGWGCPLFFASINPCDRWLFFDHGFHDDFHHGHGNDFGHHGEHFFNHHWDHNSIGRVTDPVTHQASRLGSRTAGVHNGTAVRGGTVSDPAHRVAGTAHPNRFSAVRNPTVASSVQAGTRNRTNFTGTNVNRLGTAGTTVDSRTNRHIGGTPIGTGRDFASTPNTGSRTLGTNSRTVTPSRTFTPNTSLGHTPSGVAATPRVGTGTNVVGGRTGSIGGTPGGTVGTRSLIGGLGTTPRLLAVRGANRPLKPIPTRPPTARPANVTPHVSTPSVNTTPRSSFTTRSSTPRYSTPSRVSTPARSTPRSVAPSRSAPSASAVRSSPRFSAPARSAPSHAAPARVSGGGGGHMGGGHFSGGGGGHGGGHR